jgi:hypothetical protein
MDDAVGRGRRVPQDIEIVEVTAHDLGAESGDGRGRGVGTGQPDHLLSGVEQFAGDGRADPSAGAGDEDCHEKPPGDVI